MRYPNEHIEAYRQSASELENHIIDEFKAGRLSRRELMMRGTIVGMSIPMLGLIADGAIGCADPRRSGKGRRQSARRSFQERDVVRAARARRAGRDHHGPRSR